MNDEYTEREQSGFKHFALRKYLETAVRIIGSWSDFSYVDCCAGPWESRSPCYDDTSFGIAVKALGESREWLRGQERNPQFRALLIEKEREPYKELAKFAVSAGDASLQVESRNWDFIKHTSEIVQFVARPPSFAFIFVDPKGWTPAKISGLEPLLRINPGEVLINFMSSFIVRFLNDEATDMCGILGSDYRDIRALNSSEEQEDEAVRRYCELIRKQGSFPYVCALPVMKKDQDAIHFYLIYGTRNAKGVAVFKNVEKKTEEETRLVRSLRQQNKRATLDLFAPDVLYKREERYRRLAVRCRRDAVQALDRLLSDRKSVPYDDCWAEALQFPTVYESDLRDWLKGMEEGGSIRVDGRTRPHEFLKRGYNQIIVKL